MTTDWKTASQAVADAKTILVVTHVKPDGDAIAQQTPGTMTGVTKRQKEKAIADGEYFPLYEFSIPPEAADQVLQADKANQDAQKRAREAAETK